MSLAHHPQDSPLRRLWQERVVADFRDFQFTWVGFFRWTAIVILAFLAAIILTLYFLDWNAMRGPIARYLSDRLGRPVQIRGDLHVALFQSVPHISVHDLTIANPAWAGAGTDAADLDDAEIEFRLWPALFGHLNLPLVELDRPRLSVMRTSSGRTNWDTGKAGADRSATGWAIPPIQHLRVSDGHVQVNDAIRHLEFTGTVNSEEREGGSGGAFHLNGSGTLNGDKFLAAVEGGPLIHVDESRPYDFHANLEAGPTHADITGRIAHPFHLGQWSAHVVAGGRSLADLYDLTGIPLPGTPPFRLSGTMKRDGGFYSVSGLSGALGDSDLEGYVALDTSHKVPDLKGHLSSRQLNFDDLGALFWGSKPPPQVTSKTLLPDIALHTERLHQINAEVDFEANAIKSRDFPLKGLATHISVENGVMNLKPLAFGFTAGKLAGALTIDGSRTIPVTKVDARITDIHIEHFIKSAQKPLTGTVEARARLTGQGNSVHKVAESADGQVTAVVPNGTMKASLAEWAGANVVSALGLTLSGDRSETDLRCAVMSFGVKGGVMNSRAIVLDTDPTRIDGHGSIDLRNETMDLTIQGSPKHFQLLRLRVPVQLTGKLASPTVTINKKPAIEQGLVSAGLGVLTPFAALAAFIDPGLAKNADCANILSNARSQGAPVRTSAIEKAPRGDKK